MNFSLIGYILKIHFKQTGPIKNVIPGRLNFKSFCLGQIMPPYIYDICVSIDRTLKLRSNLSVSTVLGEESPSVVNRSLHASYLDDDL